THTASLPWALPILVLLCWLAAAGGRIGSQQIIADRFDATIFPVAAVAKARRQQLEGRLFTDLAWGGYVVYAWPEQKIFIDGGTDFFGEDVFREYAKVRRMSPGWRDVLAKRDVSVTLLERKAALTHELTRDPRWNLWYCDSLAVILRRSPPSAAVMANADSAEQRLNDCAKRSSHPLRNRDQ
ncbi:MAG TPA: hypothetical protein VK535_08795, partial [Gemmatimonadales bacterium]|nr:hypothetical protein [Gemmatimonadales bacterium]